MNSRHGSESCRARQPGQSSTIPRTRRTSWSIGPGARRAATWPAHLQLVTPGRTAQATLRFARTGNFAAPQCHHVSVLFLKIVPPGDTTAAYAGGIDDQICAQPTLPTMTIATVISDS